MADHVAAGARSVEGVNVVVKRVPETVPAMLATEKNFKLDQKAPIAEPEELGDYDGIHFGAPTRFGAVASLMRDFLDRTGPLWATGALIGKFGTVFTSIGTGGGQETAITSFWPPLAHHGMLIVGLPYTAPELRDIDAVRGGSPYGAATMAGKDGTRMPSEKERALAEFQGRHVAQLVVRQRAL